MSLIYLSAPPPSPIPLSFSRYICLPRAVLLGHCWQTPLELPFSLVDVYYYYSIISFIYFIRNFSWLTRRFSSEQGASLLCLFFKRCWRCWLGAKHWRFHIFQLFLFSFSFFWPRPPLHPTLFLSLRSCRRLLFCTFWCVSYVMSLHCTEEMLKLLAICTSLAASQQ